MGNSVAERDLFVEEMAVFLENSGLPRMAGRILGHLLVCEPEHQSSAELSAALNASRGSISSMTRLLINIGFVERTGQPGRRESFFRLQPGVWSNLLAAQMERVTTARLLAERGLALMNGTGNARLEEMHALYAFMERELPGLLVRWRAEHEPRGSAA